MTQSQALSWLNAQIGQHLDYDHEYGQQCFDFFNYFYQYISGDSPYADGYEVPAAKDIWGIPNSRFTKLPDSNTLVPQPGDVAIYDASWGAGDGHVEIVDQTTDTGCYFVGENEHGNTSEGVVKVFRTWAQMKGLIGVMRYHWADGTTNTTGEDMITQPTLTFIFQQLLGRAPDAGAVSHYVGHYTPDFVVSDVSNSAEYKQHVAALAAVTQAQADQLNQLNATVASVTSDDKATKAQLQDALKQVADLTAQLKDQEKVTTGPTKPVVVSVPPKVVVVEPTYYKIWVLFIAILQKIFKKK